MARLERTHCDVTNLASAFACRKIRLALLRYRHRRRAVASSRVPFRSVGAAVSAGELQARRASFETPRSQASAAPQDEMSLSAAFPMVLMLRSRAQARRLEARTTARRDSV
jgi:hypothetical protein